MSCHSNINMSEEDEDIFSISCLPLLLFLFLFFSLFCLVHPRSYRSIYSCICLPLFYLFLSFLSLSFISLFSPSLSSLLLFRCLWGVRGACVCELSEELRRCGDWTTHIQCTWVLEGTPQWSIVRQPYR